MTGCEFGDIILVPFPFTDQSTSKKRPAVVISSANYHRSRPDYIIMAVTSRMRVLAMIGKLIVRDWREAGLLKPSTIKPIIATIEHALVLRRLGSLRADDQAALRAVISDILG
ncbi:MAG: type II toxin-antitoxin system PemK/MazF family toxin [Alphaproteobacteria bacterium]|nr:type II toxin-antitoxin system PemK/MazF family toxin [Alphaproteobacteria bacterium]